MHMRPLSHTPMLKLLGCVVDSNVRMMRVFDMQQVSTLLDVVLATEQRVDLFEADLLGFRDEEPDEDRKQEVDAGKAVKGVARKYLSVVY